MDLNLRRKASANFTDEFTKRRATLALNHSTHAQTDLVDRHKRLTVFPTSAKYSTCEQCAPAWCTCPAFTSARSKLLPTERRADASALSVSRYALCTLHLIYIKR
ncbi:hypothetical protein PoB_006552700 [Plakobranchus ocellatus]|uniref:Uncharacterized protein n=1 Tax=Plakobranchus ocellatus TaxID=259542 RepID=A0AAV4D4F3_9GAST|nr:hypothetical protein PoB_006552700 [Plakobranchus ocellatus]